MRRFDLVFPMTVLDTQHLNQHARDLHGVSAIVPTDDVIGLCEDKLALTQRLIELGFAEHMPVTGGELDYPYLLKKRVSSYGDGTFVIENAEQERELQSLLLDADYFTQEYVVGEEEYATHAIAAKGRITFSRACKYSFPSGPYVKGRRCKAMHRETLERTPFFDLFDDIVRAIDFEGVCCFNYKLRGNRIKLFEINPRFGATMALFINDALPAYEQAVSSY
ncbi:ATP-grasp domain-containing protein [Aporhodopirellula aestuarii]|uniref:ATP-grasp domain-containing protein n=1 Tax=Aporhodopirellula aestuarii TaxID=2950107 RepID=A0ABT0UB57_9BACT|nr:ATP-grasp domain-containing protein [Aporhodopirellula aestuarii]MCM2374248.1 ATP-grasp domain-containing protein [Aporhodopirellula aestuarii]